MKMAGKETDKIFNLIKRVLHFQPTCIKIFAKEKMENSLLNNWEAKGRK
jgi:hypothetical protein